MRKIFFFGLLNLLINLLINSNLWAHTQNFLLNKSSVKFEIPGDWKFYENLMEIPLTILGPIQNGFRPYIGIIDSGEMENIIYPSKIKEIMEETAKIEIDNLIKSNYSDPKIIEVGKNSKKENYLLYQIKLEYKNIDVKYYETIYYLYCNKNFLSIFTRVRHDDKEMENVIFDIVDHIRCL